MKAYNENTRDVLRFRRVVVTTDRRCSIKYLYAHLGGDFVISGWWPEWWLVPTTVGTSWNTDNSFIIGHGDHEHFGQVLSIIKHLKIKVLRLVVILFTMHIVSINVRVVSS